MILGNICSLLAMITDSLSSTRKTVKGVLMTQNLSQLIYFIGTILLKGYSSAVQNVVSVLRNFAAIRNISSPIVEWGLVALGVGFGIGFNNLGFIGLLPVIANLEYTLAVFKFKDNERALKVAFAICLVLFIVFNLSILNYVGAASNVVVLITTLVMLFRKDTTNTSEKK